MNLRTTWQRTCHGEQVVRAEVLKGGEIQKCSLQLVLDWRQDGDISHIEKLRNKAREQVRATGQITSVLFPQVKHVSKTSEMAKAPVHIIDLTKDTESLPERIVPDPGSKVEAQPCGTTEWVELKNDPLTLTWYSLDQCGRDRCPHSGIQVLKKEKKQVVLKNGKIMNVNVIAFDTHLIRITGDYRITNADPWCKECQTWHAEGNHKPNPKKVLT